MSMTDKRRIWVGVVLKLSKLIERRRPKNEAKNDKKAIPFIRKEIFEKTFVGIREGISKKLKV